MRRHITILVTLLMIVTCHTYAQQKFSVSGYVREKNSRELLPGVNIYIASIKGGTVTNNYGFYSITLPAGSYDISFSYIGYQPVIENVKLNQNLVLDIWLDPSITLEEVVISAEKAERASESNRMSMISVPVKQIRNIPALLGEKDVFKALQLLPGVPK